jgi:hypothetical protein
VSTAVCHARDDRTRERTGARPDFARQFGNMPNRTLLALASLLALARCSPSAIVQADAGAQDSARATDSESTADSATVTDASAIPDSAQSSDSGAQLDAANSGCVGRPAQCANGTSGGACGDTVTAPTCVAGEWTCGEGQVFVTSCACVGRPPGATCTCTSSGWRCDDSGVARRFACGAALTCLSGAELCQVSIPGVPGAMRSFECRALPARCGDAPSCACVAPPAGAQCMQSPSGDITVTVALP